MDMYVRGRKHGIRGCLWIVLFATLMVVLLHYVIQRKLNVTVGDYNLPKKNIAVNNDNEELQMIKIQEEERVNKY